MKELETPDSSLGWGLPLHAQPKGCPLTPVRCPEAMHTQAGQRNRLIFPSVTSLEEMLCSWKPHIPPPPLPLCVTGEPTDSLEGRPAAWRQASEGLNFLEGGVLAYCRAPSSCSGKHFSGNQQASCFGFSSCFWLLVSLGQPRI